MQLLAKILAFYFLIGSAFPQTDFGQLSKMANLWEHYQVHLAEAEETGEQLSIKDFLALHFFDSDDHSHPLENDHQELPFQSISLFVSFIFEGISLPEMSPIVSFSPALPMPQDLFSSGFLKRIFQPPIF